MNIDEAKKILKYNNYSCIEEGFLSDLKDKFVNKIQNITSYNTWYNKVINLLKTKYRITVNDLKKVIDLNCFKKCFNMDIKPLNFVKALMKKYVELVQSYKYYGDEDYLQFYDVTNDEIYEAYHIITKCNLNETTDAEMFDDMWEQSQLLNDFKTGKIKHLNKLEQNKALKGIMIRCNNLYKKAKLLKLNVTNIDNDELAYEAALDLLSDENKLRKFLTSNPNTYFTSNDIEKYVNNINKLDKEEIKTPKKKKIKNTIINKKNKYNFFDGEEL